MERIYVTVRARPLTPEDAKTSPWRISSNSISLSTNLASKFEFDRIFGEHCKTVEVYEARTKDIVGAALRGFNGTVFAYGQTNSGKTHTMRGTATEPGVIPLAVRELFNIIQEFTPKTKIPLNVLTNWCYVTVDEVIVIVKLGDVGLKLVLLGCNQTFNDKDREFLLRMSYMEIYNEDINDLLAPEHRKLQIHESPERGIYVAGLREEIVASPEQVLDLMEFGESHRHIGETNMNVYSSRSHTIFRMIIESRDKVEAEDVANHCDAVRVSVLNLVDLAGSERAAKTGAGGVRLKEGSHINKSLMTLGTVIKKLSEGAESQGGHVPYRDSKLTRILQPALGGNANTAIICNITLAQIHADETKSSLQFASRALRVTNCARVNEVLTDAALLKRQKKEIEELRAKLQGSHSVHHEEEILNLRNTLLQTELERERIALELEEEKKAQAEWERRLQEQAKKIENLSSMVLYSNRDESRELYKKDKRRDTWCPGNLSREALGEAYSTAHLKSSTINPTKPKRHMGPLLPFEELVGESEADVDDSCKEEENHQINAPEDCTLPYPLDLSRVTNRKKASLGKKSLPVDNNDLVEIQARHKDLLLQLETQGTMKGIEIDCLTRKLGEGDAFVEVKDNNNNSSNSLSRSSLLSGSPILARSPFYGDKNISSRESEAIFVIKHLQEQIKILEMEKSSSQKNLDSVVELATEQNICAREKYEELYEELVAAQEEARLAREQLTSNDCYKKIEEVNLEPSIKLLAEVHGLIFGVQNSSNSVEDISFLVDECLESFSAILTLLLDHKSFMSQNSMQLKSTIGDYQKLCHSMREIIARADNEKSILQFQIEELRLELQNSENAMKALSEQDVMEKSELLTHIEVLEKELSCLSTQALAKEKENLRKDLEKTKKKLETTEFKLKNAIQEKTKLESEKAHAEREIKRLHGQKTLLERDITKRDSLAVRKHESVIDRTSNLFDAKKGKGHAVPFEQLQDDYQQLEVLAFEMETTIASLEEELSAASAEKEEAVSKNQILASEVEALSDKLNISTSQLIALQEEVSGLVARLGESEKHHKQLERSIKLLVEEKEELAMQLTDALLEIEEEKAIWTSKERASIEIIEEKAKLYNAEIMAFSKGLSEVKNELETCKEERNVLEKMLSCTKGDAEWEKNCSEKALVMDQQTIDLKRADDDTTQEDLSNQVLDLKLERDKLSAQIAENQSHMVELDSFQKNYDELAKAKFEVEEITRKISSMEAKMHNDEVSNSKEKAKLRMRLRSTQTKLDVFRGRHMEAVDELDFMNKKFEEASAKLKEKLASCCAEVLNLKKQLATANASSIHQAS